MFLTCLHYKIIFTKFTISFCFGELQGLYILID